MKSAARSALSTVTATLTAAGFKAEVDTRRTRTPGFRVRDGQTLGFRAGIVLFDYTRGNGEFPKMCEALIAAGYTLTDANDGPDFVKFGVARVSKTTTA